MANSHSLRPSTLRGSERATKRCQWLFFGEWWIRPVLAVQFHDISIQGQATHGFGLEPRIHLLMVAAPGLSR